ncbi:GNAT family protein [uncultured Agrococcus sp.]|uniref:GNAT family N-acetyltransferase n=1 Tax=uncultured Agrococcus sp. TaxID=382258 RepID=UPI0025DDCA52|nr:GNAT family protein [uncultured Agrococcus sp.]
MFDFAPRLAHGRVVVRPIRMRDARALERELNGNRAWLQQWEAQLPGTRPPTSFDAKATIRGLLEGARAGTGMPFAIEVDGEFAGQLNVSGITWGAVQGGMLGYWVAERFAGEQVTPTATALVTDYALSDGRLHRMEVCIRPENLASLRVVEKLGFRYEGFRKRFIFIDGDWRDHLCFALVREELAEPVLQRWLAGRVPEFDRRVYQLPIGTQQPASSTDNRH